ncbi:alpha/beta fold hydrolase [Herbaspirillum sp. WGmk3]|uniref:alpha/beta fold hydrolase n=1 Tax=Herbaspirillum sp. WGmk3 TaxID=2919925 RepID=UPI0020915797|nr:alpha/beta fold hydrolase [Herbaspirillum sp. WGmk3]MCO4857060.1 alpha/beta fold hydrolase [Herbaspirillum sp. WGmk3]
MSERQDAYIETEGGTLYASVWGGSPEARTPIVLLHDSLGSVALWRDFPARLAAQTGLPVIAYDRAGFGQSSARTDGLALDFISAEAPTSLSAVLQHFAVDKVILFGHSVGGGMAVSAAAQWPQRVLAVITESAQAFVEDRTLQGIQEARTRFADPAQLARLAKYHGNDLQQARWVLSAWIDTWLSPSFAHWSLAPMLERLRCPVLALHGDLDEFGSLTHPRMIASLPAAFPGQGESRVLAQCGHVPHREQADQVMRAAREFLLRHGLI